MEKEYYIARKYMAKPRLLVTIDGVLIDLKGQDATLQSRATAKVPAQDVQVKGATQEVLKALLEGKEKYGDFSRIIKVRDKGAVIAAPAELPQIEE